MPTEVRIKCVPTSIIGPHFKDETTRFFNNEPKEVLEHLISKHYIGKYNNISFPFRGKFNYHHKDTLKQNSSISYSLTILKAQVHEDYMYHKNIFEEQKIFPFLAEETDLPYFDDGEEIIKNLIRANLMNADVCLNKISMSPFNKRTMPVLKITDSYSYLEEKKKKNPCLKLFDENIEEVLQDIIDFSEIVLKRKVDENYLRNLNVKKPEKGQETYSFPFF